MAFDLKKHTETWAKEHMPNDEKVAAFVEWFYTRYAKAIETDQSAPSYPDAILDFDVEWRRTHGS